MYKRVDRRYSALRNGRMFGRDRNNYRFALVLACLIGICSLVFIQVKREWVQSKVMLVIGMAPPPTESPLDFARQGDAAFWQGDLNSAIENYRSATTVDPTNINILYELVRMLIYRSYGDVRNAKDVDEAQNWASQAVSYAPQNERSYAINCFALLTASKSEDAVRACNQALQLNPNDADAHAYLSLSYYDLGRNSTALSEGKTAVDLQPQSIDAQTAYAFSLWFVGQFTQAREHFKAAAEINPKLEFPYFNLGGFASALAIKDESQYALAIAVYENILNVNTKSVKAYTKLCQTYLAKSERSETDILLARQNCNKATKLDDQYSPAWRWLGEVQYRSRDYEDALDSLGKCYDLEKNLQPGQREEECWFLRGAAYFILDECDVARPILEDVLSWATTNVAIEQSNIVINKCKDAYSGNYRTPTPKPSPAPKPTPIL